MAMTTTLTDRTIAPFVAPNVEKWLGSVEEHEHR
jgi:hypothetical protein